MTSLRGQKDNIALLREAFSAARLAARYYKVSKIRTFMYALQLARKHHMRPLEAFEYGAFAPGASDIEGYLSKRTCSKLQQRLNPKEWFWVTEDKGVFNSMCVAASIPVPECIALLYRNSSGVSMGKPVAPSQQAWAQTLKSMDLNNVVIKPCRHSYGRGLMIPVTEGKRISAGGNWFDSAEKLASFMFDAPELTSWIVQAKVRSHPDLDRFSGTEHLQTMRLYTHVGQNGKVHLIDAFLKVIGSDAVIDNFQHGALGNFIAPIEIGSGRLESAITRTEDYQWLRLEKHPKTGQSFCDFTVPWWNEAKDLVVQSADRFKPIRSLGWDVAVTESGPVVIETNIRWDPPNWNAQTVKNVKRVLENPDVL